MDIPYIIKAGAFDWKKKGYSYRLTGDEYASLKESPIDNNPWMEILKIVERAKTGDFSRVPDLSKFIKTNSEFNTAPVSLMLIGDMGSRDDLSVLVEVMMESHEGFAAYACEAARNAGTLWLIPYMIEAWKRSKTVHAHEMIGFAISDLLESANTLDEDGPLANLAGQFTQVFRDREASSRLKSVLPNVVNEGADDEFVNLSTSLYRKISDEISNKNISVWSACPIGPIEFAEIFLSLITNQSYTHFLDPLTVKFRHKFEAMTGVDCSKFYFAGRFQQMLAVGILEKYLENAVRCDYKVGERYFFGHQVI